MNRNKNPAISPAAEPVPFDPYTADPGDLKERIKKMIMINELLSKVGERLPGMDDPWPDLTDSLPDSD
jgi:hypothetical protein